MTWGRDCELKGVMKPSEPMANGTMGGTGSVPMVLHAHSRVPSPPSVATKSIADATGRGHSVQSAASTPAGGCHVATRPLRHVAISPSRSTCTPYAYVAFSEGVKMCNSSTDAQRMRVPEHQHQRSVRHEVLVHHLGIMGHITFGRRATALLSI